MPVEKVLPFLNLLHPISGGLEAALRSEFRFTRKRNMNCWFVKVRYAAVHGTWKKDWYDVIITKIAK